MDNLSKLLFFLFVLLLIFFAIPGKYVFSEWESNCGTVPATGCFYHCAGFSIKGGCSSDTNPCWTNCEALCLGILTNNCSGVNLIAKIDFLKSLVKPEA